MNKAMRSIIFLWVCMLQLAGSARAYAAEPQSDKAELNSINMTLPGGGFVDDFGGPVSAPGTQSGLAINGGTRSDFLSLPTESIIRKEIAAMKQANKKVLPKNK